MNPNGYGFVHVEEGDENVFIPPRRQGAALDGDRVEVVARRADKGLEGEVTEVLERRRHRLVGVLRQGGRRGPWIEMEDPRITHTVVLEGDGGSAAFGDVVAARILAYPEHHDDNLVVQVERSLGQPGLLATEVAKILVEHNVDDFFPPEVEAEAETVPTEVIAEDLVSRKDLRNLPFMTIDPDDARDFDDAVCVEVLGNGNLHNDDMRLHVAVADVSHYVREGTAIDTEAKWRCFSVYLPNRAIPMLPEQLSSHMCSLVPNQDRLAMVVSMTVEADGTVKDVSPAASVIHSQKRLSYREVAHELEVVNAGDGAGEQRVDDEVLERITVLRRCADRLRGQRMRRGAVELNLPEARVVLDEDDPERIRDVVKSRSSKEMSRAYNLIEELMLAANEAMGALAEEHDLPVPYRTHGKPDEEKLTLLATAAESLGVRVDPDKLHHPRGVQKFLNQIETRDRSEALNAMMLRAMAQAEYSVDNVGHFALASRAYLHYTSPIRRYPDLIAHRVTKAWLSRRKKYAGPKPVPRMPEPDVTRQMAIRSSERERAAAQAERDTQKLFAASHMMDRVGDRFEATVSGFSNAGMFVTLDAPFVDGMVKLQQLNRELRDTYELEETGVRIVGRGGKTITIGDRVMVEVEHASLVRRQIDLLFIQRLTS